MHSFGALNILFFLEGLQTLNLRRQYVQMFSHQWPADVLTSLYVETSASKNMEYMQQSSTHKVNLCLIQIIIFIPVAPHSRPDVTRCFSNTKDKLKQRNIYIYIKITVIDQLFQTTNWCCIGNGFTMRQKEKAHSKQVPKSKIRQTSCPILLSTLEIKSILPPSPIWTHVPCLSIFPFTGCTQGDLVIS